MNDLLKEPITRRHKSLFLRRSLAFRIFLNWHFFRLLCCFPFLVRDWLLVKGEQFRQAANDFYSKIGDFGDWVVCNLETCQANDRLKRLDVSWFCYFVASGKEVAFNQAKGK